MRSWLIGLVAVARGIAGWEILQLLLSGPGLSAPEPHDFAVRADAARLTTPARPPHSATTFTAMAIRPLLGAERGSLYAKSEFLETGIFLLTEIDRILRKLPGGQISLQAGDACTAIAPVNAADLG